MTDVSMTDAKSADVKKAKKSKKAEAEPSSAAAVAVPVAAAGEVSKEKKKKSKKAAGSDDDDKEEEMDEAEMRLRAGISVIADPLASTFITSHHHRVLLLVFNTVLNTCFVVCRQKTDKTLSQTRR